MPEINRLFYFSCCDKFLMFWTWEHLWCLPNKTLVRDSCQPMREDEKDKKKEKKWGGKRDDITGGLMCVSWVEVLTSSVTGRGRVSAPYVGHIKYTCSYHRIQPTNQEAQNCLSLPVPSWLQKEKKKKKKKRSSSVRWQNEQLYLMQQFDELQMSLGNGILCSCVHFFAKKQGKSHSANKFCDSKQLGSVNYYWCSENSAMWFIYFPIFLLCSLTSNDSFLLLRIKNYGFKHHDAQMFKVNRSARGNNCQTYIQRSTVNLCMSHCVPFTIFNYTTML